MTEKEHPVGETTRKIFPSGRSVAVTLPAQFCKAHGIKAGDSIRILYDSFLLLDPPKEPRKDKEQILSEMEEKRKAVLESGLVKQKTVEGSKKSFKPKGH